MTNPVRVDIFSDVICPWCLIGYHRLRKALAIAIDSTVELHWLPFELNPDMPEQGMDRQAYLEAKFGKQRAASVYGQIADTLEAEGIEARLDKIERTPNTFKAHRLLYLARPFGLANELKQSLFQGYFFEGADIGDPTELIERAVAVGLERDQVEAWLAGDAGESEVRQLEEEGHRLGISGVPFLIFNRRLAVSGAQAPEILAQALERASNERGGQA